MQTRIESEQQIKQIASRCHHGAIETTVFLYRDLLLRRATSILRDSADAHDIVQEVFIRACHEPRLFTDDFKIRAWLYRVTSNLCFNRVRNRRRRGLILSNLPTDSIVSASQLDAIICSQREDLFLSAIGSLSAIHSEILRLRFYLDLSYQEIADLLSIRLGTVMSRLSRAKVKLMEILELWEVA